MVPHSRGPGLFLGPGGPLLAVLLAAVPVFTWSGGARAAQALAATSQGAQMMRLARGAGAQRRDGQPTDRRVIAGTERAGQEIRHAPFLPSTISAARLLSPEAGLPLGIMLAVFFTLVGAGLLRHRGRHSASGIIPAPPRNIGPSEQHQIRRIRSAGKQSVVEEPIVEHERLVRACADQLAYLGHEIRTPVTAVVGMADVLSRAKLPDEQRRCVDTILKSCDALTSVVETFLDFSRIQSQTLTLDRRDFDLHEIVEEVLDMLTYPAHTKGLELAALIEPGVPTRLQGDPARLRQILLNLMGNSVKFTERGHVLLRVVCVGEKRGTACVQFYVCDTGSGISELERSSIFQAFTRGNGSARELRAGLGLGLYIAKCLVEKMGGEIGVDGMSDVGSTFWFTAHIEKQEQASRTFRSKMPAIREQRLLIVGDSPLLRNVLSHYAEQCGAPAHAVANATQALNALRAAADHREPYRLMLVDAGMDGYEILRLVETVREDEGLPMPELVMLTTLGSGLDPMVAGLLGRYFELAKPLKQSKFADSLRSVLEGDAEATHAQTLAAATSRATVLTPGITPGDSRSLDSALPRPLRLLLAEDNPVTQDAIAELLRELGCVVDLAGDGASAIRAARAGRYDAIFMDLQMPGSDGCQAAREIRRHQDDDGATPIIGLTAHLAENVRETCLRAGMVDYVSKPVRAEGLAAVLVRHCGPERRSHRSAAAGKPADENPMAVYRLMTLFLEDSQTRLNEMRRAMAQGDVQAVAQQAHALVGSARMVGALDMGRACKSLETLALADAGANPSEALDKVEAEFERLCPRNARKSGDDGARWH